VWHRQGEEGGKATMLRCNGPKTGRFTTGTAFADANDAPGNDETRFSASTPAAGK